MAAHLPGEALEDKMRFSGSILGIIVTWWVTLAAAVGHQQPRCVAGVLSLSLQLFQLPGSLLPRKGRKSPPRGSHHGQRRLE